MVKQMALNHQFGVRIPAGQPFDKLRAIALEIEKVLSKRSASKDDFMLRDIVIRLTAFAHCYSP